MSALVTDMMQMVSRLFAICAIALALCLPAFATEVIYNLNADVTLNLDGSVAVVEDIEVRAEGDKIKRGIYRDIPTVLDNGDGSKLRSTLEVLGVERDGQAEPFFTESITNGLRIYIGQSDVFLKTGTYRYTIRYTMTRMARHFADYDEIFWNATGNFWDFPILKSTATITLPEGAKIDDLAVYTGAFGETKGAARITRTADNIAMFRMAQTLAPYEGMSVAVGFQKGILHEPQGLEKLFYALLDYRAIVLPVVALLLVILYYLFAWDAVGRDPKKGTIIPLFYPPKNTSPALTHYIWAMGWKKNGWQAFTAAMISLGVKGLIEIDKVGKKTRMTVVKDIHDTDLPPGEAVIYNHLSSKDGLIINKKTGPGLNARRAAFVQALETENRHAYFRNNYVYVVIGVVLSLLSAMALVFADALPVEWMVVSLFGGVLFGVLTSAFRTVWLRGGILRYFQMALFGFFGVNMAMGAGTIFSDLVVMSNITPIVAAASIIAINITFAILMRAPTAQGRRMMDQIDGFRMYLETAEKHRLNFVDEPELSVKRFEAILPYAIALGVEKPWTERFEAELARHAVPDAGAGYAPGWYQSSDFSSHSISSDMAGIATGMSAAMIAAQPASSSSSGSSGGGSSGGGGGGGGGGGW